MLNFIPILLRPLIIKHQRFLRFAAVGVVCTLVDYVVFFSLHHWNVAIVPAQIAAYSTGILVNFLLNRRFTFADSAHKKNKRLSLAFIWGYSALAMSTLLVWLLAQALPLLLAKMLTTGIMLFVNYAANKFIIFRV